MGLTGGIACGKDLVAGCFESEGIPVIDTDPIGHELIEPGAACYRPLLDLFGPEVLDEDGHIQHRRVAEIVFSDPDKLSALNALMHPVILDEAERRAGRLHREHHHPIVMVSAALLVEAGVERRFDRIVLVACRRQVQLRRLRRRDALSPEMARARLAAQLTDSERRRAAHYVIDNSGDRTRTRRQVRQVVKKLWALARRRFPGLVAKAAAAREQLGCGASRQARSRTGSKR
ncbi:MAG: dephospho-CoA kinase [Acidobacteriota bacterium]